MKKFIIILTFLVISALSYCDDAIPDNVIAEGNRRFSGSRDIFRGTLTDPDAWKAGRDEAVARMNSIFTSGAIGTILQSRDNKWVVTLKLSDPKYARKTIADREKLRIDGNDYLVIALENGIKVVDIKTKYDIIVDKQSLRR